MDKILNLLGNNDTHIFSCSPVEKPVEWCMRNIDTVCICLYAMYRNYIEE